jgi:hypothetical protein
VFDVTAVLAAVDLVQRKRLAPEFLAGKPLLSWFRSDVRWIIRERTGNRSARDRNASQFI